MIRTRNQWPLPLVWLVGLLALAPAVHAADDLTAQLRNGQQPAPGVITGGSLAADAPAALAAAGVQTVVDLRTAAEGVPAEAAALAAVGVRHLHVPVSAAAPDAATLDAVAAALAEASPAAPVVLHCGSGNRVGDVWVRLRVRAGVPLRQALEEGRAIGMRVSREAAVMADLGGRQPAL